MSKKKINGRVVSFEAEGMMFHVPAPALADEASGLVGLTREIHRRGLADGSAGGIFGGEFGYGADYENDVFMLHRYCWCDREDCRWCAQGAPHFVHKASGSTVTWYKYIGRSMELDLKVPWGQIMQDCFASLAASPTVGRAGSDAEPRDPQGDS